MALPAAIASSGVSIDVICDELDEQFRRNTNLLLDPIITSPPSSPHATTKPEFLTHDDRQSESSNSSRKFWSYYKLITQMTLELLKTDEKPQLPLNSMPVRAKVIRDGRNILDLGANLRGTWEYRAAVVDLKTDPTISKQQAETIRKSSLISLYEDVAPKHIFIRCGKFDCSFVQPYYFS